MSEYHPEDPTMTNHRPDDEDEVQEVIDALLADKAFMESLDKLIDDADQTQAWMEAVIDKVQV